MFFRLPTRPCFFFFGREFPAHQSVLRSGVKSFNLREEEKRRNKNWRASNIIVLVKYVSLGAMILQGEEMTKTDILIYDNQPTKN